MPGYAPCLWIGETHWRAGHNTGIISAFLSFFLRTEFSKKRFHMYSVSGLTELMKTSERSHLNAITFMRFVRKALFHMRPRWHYHINDTVFYIELDVACASWC